jgi:hypothetical protein
MAVAFPARSPEHDQIDVRVVLGGSDSSHVYLIM